MAYYCRSCTLYVFHAESDQRTQATQRQFSIGSIDLCADSSQHQTICRHCGMPTTYPKIGRDSIVLSRLRPSTIRNQTIIGPLQPNGERVVVTVHLSDHNGAPPDLGQWTTWLTSNLPSNVSKTQITIEGVFDTDSVVILVSMPLEVWTMLPDGDGAYGFVSFVKSGNRLLQRQTTLSLRDTKENLPMTSLLKDQRGLGGSGGFGGSSGGH